MEGDIEGGYLHRREVLSGKRLVKDRCRGPGQLGLKISSQRDWAEDRIQISVKKKEFLNISTT